MKKALIILSCVVFLSCQESNPKYEANLAIAKSFFALHETEDFTAQIAMLHKDLEAEPPMYGSEMLGYDEVAGALKGYHDAFDNIKWTPNVWLPGSDESGKLDGSVRTYGEWSGTHVGTGKTLKLRSYHYMNFDDQGKIIGLGDFFDFGGMYDAVYSKSLVFATLTLKPNKADAVVALLNSSEGLPATKAYEGCVSAEMVYNPETNTIYISTDWQSNDAYMKYREWRLNEDTFVGKLVPHLVGGEKGLFVAHSNTGYTSF